MTKPVMTEEEYQAAAEALTGSARKGFAKIAVGLKISGAQHKKIETAARSTVRTAYSKLMRAALDADDMASAVRAYKARRALGVFTEDMRTGLYRSADALPKAKADKLRRNFVKMIEKANSGSNK